MIIVLVTGSMGAGKSSVIAYLKAKACSVFQADNRAKEFLSPKSPCYSRLKKLFSEDGFVHSHGGFDRKKLAEVIFKYPEKKKAMESIVHPLVQKAFKKFIKDQKKQGQNKIFYEAPLISKIIFDPFDKKILVTCPKNLKKKRLIKKGWTEKEIDERWAVQVPDSVILSKVDFIIDNKADLKSLNRQIDNILSLINY